MSPISAMLPNLSAAGISPQMDLQKLDLSKLDLSKLDMVPPGGLSIPGVKAPSLDRPHGVGHAPGADFSSMLGRMVAEVSAKQGAATETVAALQAGQNVPLHQAVIAMEEASVSFQLMVEVRNKLLESYQELMRMQI